MFELEPESPELMAYYRGRLEWHRRISDSCCIPEFSKDLRRDLADFLPDNEAVDLVEVVTRIGNFTDADNLSSLRKAVARLHRARGVKMPRGKRTAPGLREFVGCIAPILLFYGVPLATGGRSKLVRALQMIALELDLRGDPRDELRRLKKIRQATSDAQERLAYNLVSLARGHLAPVESKPPSNITLPGERLG